MIRAKKDGRTPPAAKASKTAPEEPRKDNLRETIESIAIAFILAFLFRTFEAEAFVIPTGSMAPTLMGQHKDVYCDVCGYRYQVSASEMSGNDPAAGPSDNDIVECVCPMCRYRMNVDRNPPLDGPPPRNLLYDAFHGDRILVSKFSYHLSDPQRWDVAVFKYPQSAKENYIKRLVGLPNETVRIHRGDIWTRPAGADTFTIQRKPPRKCQAMLQPVFDNAVMPQIAHYGWPARWYPAGPYQFGTTHIQGTLPPGQFQPQDQFTRYTTDGSADGPVWLRYEHRQPTSLDWDRLTEGKLTPQQVARIAPQLITDAYAYNGGIMRRDWEVANNPPGQRAEAHDVGLHWVGDLSVECQLDVTSSKGRVTLELIEAGVGFQCQFDLASGDCTLFSEADPDYRPTAKGVLRGPGSYRVQFANVDDKLYVWVDGSEVKFDKPTEYSFTGAVLPTERDLAPVGISSEQAAVSVSQLKVYRDIYYVAVDPRLHMSEYWKSPGGLYGDYPLEHDPFATLPIKRVRGNLSIPFEEAMAMFMRGVGSRGFEPIAHLRTSEFTLADDQFLACGDNSPRSSDSRMWEYQYFVTRDLLIGKALYVYWPHAWPFDWSVQMRFRIWKFYMPFVPDFGRMKLIR